MSLALSLIKPKLVNKAPLCTFRSSKSYLWGVVRDRLHILSSTPSLNVLDAACHSLITRHIFPSNWNYFGLDISRSRLTSAFSKKKSNDVLFLADLTKQLPSSLLLDVVVSLNTLSHLPHGVSFLHLIILFHVASPPPILLLMRQSIPISVI